MDYGERYTDKKISAVDRELKQTYRTAQSELKEKLAEFMKKHAAKNREKRRQLDAGKITEQEYRDWLTGQIFTRNKWQQQIKMINAVLLDHNRQALNIVQNSRIDVFAENYNINAWRAERETGVNFNIYSGEAVARLIEGDPQLLPEWEIDKEKDYIWNQRRVNNILKQGILQGEDMEKIMQRLCVGLATSNEKKMRMFARTAMNGAQNAGRQKQMEDASKMGIEVNKRWIAVHDSRTRDAHRDLDGTEVPFDKPFKSLLGEIMFPGDPTAEPGNVYNCRCRTVTIYPKYEDRSKKWGEGEIIDGQTYEEWKKGKKARGEVVKPGRISEAEKTSEKVAIDLSAIPTLKEYDEAREWAKDALTAELEDLKSGWANVEEQIEAIKQFEKEIPEYEKTLRDAVEKYEFSTRTDSDSLRQILKDGRFKSQYETGASHGVLDEDMRDRAARQLFAFGESLSIPDEGHEIYGYLGNAPRASMYGNCHIVFKKENLIDRTTLTVGDSLELNEIGANPFATLANNPGIESAGIHQFHSSLPTAKHRLEEIQKDFELLKQNGHIYGGNYVELQYHGGVTVDDIEYIQMSKQSLYASEIEELANEKGVKIKWMR